jgi:uncharacterized protein (DUF952 family)
MDRLIFKILSRQDWTAAASKGVYKGSVHDARDGFIHFSTANQLAETATKHFAGQADLVVVAINAKQLPQEALKWEASRGGDLFPHLYGVLDPDTALWVDDLVWDDSGAPILPQAVSAC